MEAQWRALSRGPGLEGQVHFLGQVEERELVALYRTADLMVLPSSERSEAFGLVQLEAMASGTPVVSTELGTGTSFVNRHGETGLVVPARNAEALRGAIAALLADSERRERMGQAGLVRAQDFSAGCMLERILDLYEEVLARP
jgi:rhamnosyl/mannosyltransferase